ncbi:hypothetical protein ACFL6U_18890 [Planctomycetota bacterium]
MGQLIGNKITTNRKWEFLFCGVLAILFFCVSGCSQERLFQFSPEAPFERGARLTAFKPPGKPFDEIATIWSTHPLRITLIKSSDGIVLYKSTYNNTTTGLFRTFRKIPLPAGMECQLPEGTYTIAGHYGESDTFASSKSTSAASTTVDLKKGYGYNFYRVRGDSDKTWNIAYSESKMVSPDP